MRRGDTAVIRDTGTQYGYEHLTILAVHRDHVMVEGRRGRSRRVARHRIIRTYPPECDAAATTRCTGETRAVCFQCGMPACVECSARLTYGRYGRRRICANCVEGEWCGNAQRRALDAIYGRDGWQGDVAPCPDRRSRVSG